MSTTGNQNKTNFKFSGGDKLTGMDKIYHELMMRNELKGGEGAYEVTYAGEESGISFGGNQMDMKKDKERAIFFIDILTQAKDEIGNPIFTKNEIEVIAGLEYTKLTGSQKSVESVFGNYLSRVNAALSSEYGRATIDAIYPIEIKKRADHIEIAIEKMTNPAAKNFYDSEMGKVLLFDYHNQFGLGLNGDFLVNYINGEGRKYYTTGENIPSPRESYTIDQHFQYIRSTKQYYDSPKGCERRIKNIIAILKEFLDIEITRDFAFTFDKLKGRWKIYPGLKMPEIPRPQGRQSFFFNTVADYFFLPSASHDVLFKQNFFYYRAESKKLFYVKDEGLGLPPPGNNNDNANKWITLCIGLSPLEQKLFLEFPGQINTQNYVVYVIQVKTVLVEIEDLMRWLGNVIIEKSQMGLLANVSV